MAKVGDLTVKLDVSKLLRPSREHEVMYRIEEFLSREFAVAIGPDAEVRLRIESIDHRYDDYRRDAHRISLRLDGYVMKRKKPSSRAVGKARVGTPYECGVCKAPPGVPCTSSCDDDRVPDHEVTPYMVAPRGLTKERALKVWSDDVERTRYGRDIERGQSSASRSAPRTKRLSAMRKEGVATEDEATLADLLCEEVQP